MNKLTLKETSMTTVEYHMGDIFQDTDNGELYILSRLAFELDNVGDALLNLISLKDGNRYMSKNFTKSEAYSVIMEQYDCFEYIGECDILVSKI